MTSYCPWRDLGARYPEIHVAIRDIAPARAAWVSGLAVILVDRTLGRIERRAAMAHELAHIDLGHRRRGIARFDDRQERDADELAARRLISVEALADALATTHDEAQLVEALNVAAYLIHVRVRHLYPSERHFIEQRIARIEQVA